MSSSEKAERTTKKENNVFVSSDCPVKKVTVYSDRAEVCRLLEAEVKRGVNEVVLKQLPSCIDPDSIRVEGKGPATIAEVTYQEKFLPKNEADTSDKEKELSNQLDELRKEKENVLAKQSVVTKQWTVLQNFGDTVSQSAKGNNAPALDDKYFTGITSFLKLYNNEGNKLETARLDIERQLAALNDRISAAEGNLHKIKGSRMERHMLRECTIVLECEDEAKVTLFVSYVVERAGWTPSYDIRMFTSEGTMKIMYYGQIKQSTGEDWVDAKLFLSTAAPSIGGIVPRLATQVLSIKTYFASSFRRQAGSSVISRSFGSFRRGKLSGESLESTRRNLLNDMEYTVSKVSESTTSASYEIARNSSIPSDDVEHKVSVGIFDVKPQMEYITIPKVAPHAFLQAHVTNNSQFMLLPGTSSIFLDNSFVAKAEIKAVSPGEEFECSLGVDPSVKVTYKPMRKFRESWGLLSKTTCTTHEQVIEIKNTHEYGIKVQLKDQLPRSSDEKIKINLLEPAIDLKHPEKNKSIRLTKHNHVEWDLDMAKQEKKEVTLKYSVEQPAGNEISTSEVFESGN